MADKDKDPQNQTIEPDDVPQAGPEDSPPIGGREGEGEGVDVIEEQRKQDKR